MMDPFEEELRGITPQGVSSRLREGIGDRLSVAPARSRSRALMGIGLAIVAAALVAVLWRPHDERDGETKQVVAVPVVPTAPEAGIPTALDFARALARSPEAGEALLNRPTVHDLRSDSTVTTASALMRARQGDL